MPNILGKLHRFQTDAVWIEEVDRPADQWSFGPSTSPQAALNRKRCSVTLAPLGSGGTLNASEMVASTRA